MSVTAYLSAIRSAHTASGKAWGISLTDLTGANEEAIIKYFDAASAALIASKVEKDDPRRVMVRNHKSALVGLVKRGGAVKPGLGKSKVEADNREARKGANGPKKDEKKEEAPPIPDQFLAAVRFIIDNWDKVSDDFRGKALQPLITKHVAAQSHANSAHHKKAA